MALLGSVAREGARNRCVARAAGAAGRVDDPRQRRHRGGRRAVQLGPGDRRVHVGALRGPAAARCESCSGSTRATPGTCSPPAWSAGKGAPESVTAHPTTFVTLTAPTFGPVHGRRRGAPCRARRDKPVCPHGRPLYCLHRHREDDRRLGEPLCADCYDYVGPRAVAVARPRTVAPLHHRPGPDPGPQRRGVAPGLRPPPGAGVLHEGGRVPGPGPDPRPRRHAPRRPHRTRLPAPARPRRPASWAPPSPPPPGPCASRSTPPATAPTRWGGVNRSTPARSRLGAGRDDQAGDVHPEMVAAYLAKYLTKSTEDFGLDGHGRVHSATDARYFGASPHAVRIIETAEQLAATGGEDYQRLADRYGTLGYRGHVMTKTRRYSTTFGALRQARAEWRQRGGRPAPERARRTRRPSSPATTTTRRRPGRDRDRTELALRRDRLLRHRHRRPGAHIGGARPVRGDGGQSRTQSASFTSWPPSLTGGAGGSRAAEAKNLPQARVPRSMGVVRRALDAAVEPVTLAGPGVKEPPPSTTNDRKHSPGGKDHDHRPGFHRGRSTIPPRAGPARPGRADHDGRTGGVLVAAGARRCGSGAISASARGRSGSGGIFATSRPRSGAGWHEECRGKRSA